MAESSTVPTGERAPDFTLPKLGGGELSLASYRGQSVVLVFLRGFS